MYVGHVFVTTAWWIKDKAIQAFYSIVSGENANETPVAFLSYGKI